MSNTPPPASTVNITTDQAPLASLLTKSVNFCNLRGSGTFERLALPHLLSATEQFFGAKVTYCPKPINKLKNDHLIDITTNPRRGVYQIGDDFYVLGRVMDGRDVVAYFSLKIVQPLLGDSLYFFNVFEAALTLSLTRSYKFEFEDRPQQFGEDLIELSIAKYFSRGYYDYRKFLVLIQIFNKLASTRFEGRNFTTGLILTRALYAFAGSGNDSREGARYKLKKKVNISPRSQVEKRFWYLADGQTSFFVSDKHLRILDLFTLKNPAQRLQTFVDDYSLNKTVKGGDALFRVTSQAEFSITGAGGVEFNYKEGKWRFRNLKAISAVVKDTLGVNEEFVQSLLYFVFYLSRRRLSAILWIPHDIEKINDVLLSQNEITEEMFSILNPEHTQTALRLLSSDGATVIDRNGSILSYGSIIDISKISVSGVTGTGETVSELLATNGLSFKISQDGNIKLFPGRGKQKIVF